VLAVPGLVPGYLVVHKSEYGYGARTERKDRVAALPRLFCACRTLNKQISRTEQSSVAGIPAFLSVCDPEFHPLVLLGTRLALNRIVVTRYGMQLEHLRLAPFTINQRLAADRRLAYEASDAGLLSPELPAGSSAYGREATRRTTRQLAKSRARTSFGGGTITPESPRKTRPRDARSALGMRSTTI
jgi:hypothetical protein